MAGSNRDVTLGIGIETSGADKVRELADEVKELAGKGKAANPAFEALSNSLQELVTQAEKVDAVKALAKDVDDLAQQETEAAAKTKALGESLAAQTEKVNGAKAAQKAFATEILQAKDALRNLNAQIALNRETNDAAAKGEAKYRQEQGALLAQQREAAAALDNLRAAQKAQTAEVSKAEQELRKLTTEQGRAEREASKAATALEAQKAALAQASEAARAAGVALDDLTQIDRRLVAAQIELGRVTEADANARRNAKAAVNALAAALQRLAEQERRAADEAEYLTGEAKKAGIGLREAFGAAGVRSLQAIQAEVSLVGASLGLLETKYRQGVISAQDLARATSSAQVRLAQLRQEARSLNELPGVFERINSQINSLVTRFGSLSAAVAAVGFGVKPVLDANIQLETLQRTLKAVTGSGDEAARQIEFLQQTADRYGLSVSALSDNYTGFAASMLKSGRTIGETKTLFEGVAAASDTLGLSSEKTGLILTALGQISNKGKVSLEELQGQIGESLPGALKIAADSLGITTAELQGLIKEGRLMSEDFLPAFGNALVKTFAEGERPVSGLRQAFARLGSEATKTAQSINDTEGYKALVGVIDSLARNFDTLVNTTVAAAKAFAAFKALDMAREFLGIKAAAEAAAAGKVRETVATEAATVAEVANTAARNAATASIVRETEATVANTAAKTLGARAAGVWGTAVGALGTVGERTAGAIAGMSTRIGTLVAAMGGPWTIAITALIALHKEIGDAIAGAAARVTGLTGAIEASDKAMQQHDLNLKRVQRANKELAAEVERTVAQELIAAQKREDAAESAVRVAENVVKATKEQGEASARLAELAGDEGRALRVAADAAGANEAAARSLVVAKQGLVTALQAEVDGMIEAAGGFDNLSKARQAEIEKIRERITEAQSDIEVSKQQAASLGAVADKAFMAARAHEKHGASLKELQTDVEQARINYEALSEALKEGLTTEERVADAARDLAVAQGLAAQATKELEQAFNELGISTPRQIEEAVGKANRLKEALKEAAAQGKITGNDLARGMEKANDEIDRVTPGINSAREAMKSLGVTSQAELRRTADEAKTAYDKLRFSGEATTRELGDAFKAMAEKAIAANDGVADAWIEAEAAARGYIVSVDEAGKATVKAAQEGANALQGLITGQRDATAALEERIAAEERANALKERAIELENKRRGVDSQGFSADANGNRIVMEAPNWKAAFELAKSNGADEATAKKIASKYFDSDGRWTKGDTKPGEVWTAAVARSVADWQRTGYGGAGIGVSGGVNSNAAPGSKPVGDGPIPGVVNDQGPMSRGSTVHTVNINFGTAKTSVNAASAEDAQRLQDILTQLTQQMKRSA